MHFSRAACLAVAAAATLAGCASSGYRDSQLVGHRDFRTPIDTDDVTILRVDDRDTVQRPALVDPGLRRVTVQGPSAPASPQGEERSIDLQVAPSMRFDLVAERRNRLAPGDRIKVDFEEPVIGCTPPPAALP